MEEATRFDVSLRSFKNTHYLYAGEFQGCRILKYYCCNGVVFVGNINYSLILIAHQETLSESVAGQFLSDSLKG